MDVLLFFRSRVQFLGLLLLGLVLTLGACGTDDPDRPTDVAPVSRPSIPDSMTIPRMLDTDDRFSTLRALLDSTGLDSVLAADGPYTLFAPPNEAFEALPPGTLEALLADQRSRLRTTLARHIVDRRLSIVVSADTQIIMRSGDTLTLRPTPRGAQLGSGTVVDGDIEAANGHLHVLDRVLPLPSDETP